MDYENMNVVEDTEVNEVTEFEPEDTYVSDQATDSSDEKKGLSGAAVGGLVVVGAAAVYGAVTAGKKLYKWGKAKYEAHKEKKELEKRQKELQDKLAAEVKDVETGEQLEADIIEDTDK